MIVRAACPGDAMEVAGVHVRAWQVGYRGLLPDAYLDGLRAEERAARFYRRDGWVPDGHGRAREVWGAASGQLRYRRALL